MIFDPKFNYISNENKFVIISTQLWYLNQEWPEGGTARNTPWGQKWSGLKTMRNLDPLKNIRKIRNWRSKPMSFRPPPSKKNLEKIIGPPPWNCENFQVWPSLIRIKYLISTQSFVTFRTVHQNLIISLSSDKVLRRV